MLAIALRARPMRRVSVTRKRLALVLVLAATARALRVLREPNLHSTPTRPGRRPIVLTFINYDVLDVIDPGRRVN
jgi:hypothetical protein